VAENETDGYRFPGGHLHSFLFLVMAFDTESDNVLVLRFDPNATTKESSLVLANGCEIETTLVCSA